MSVVVYSQARCQGCDMVKGNLTMIGVPFVEKRIDQDEEAKAFILGRGHRSVPVIYFGDKHYPSVNALVQALDL